MTFRFWRRKEKEHLEEAGGAIVRLDDTLLQELAGRMAFLKSVADGIIAVAGCAQEVEGRLAETVASLGQSGEQVSTALEAARRSALATQRLGQEARECTAALARIDQGVRALAARNGQIVRTIREFAAEAAAAAELIGQGDPVPGETDQELAQVSEQMREAESTMQQLSTRSERMTRVIESAGKLADQAEILAAQAAVQAAQKGSAGRDYLTVADGMRRLVCQLRGVTDEMATAMAESRQGMADLQTAVSAGRKIEARAAGVMAVASSVRQALAALGLNRQRVRAVISAAGESDREVQALAEALSEARSQAARHEMGVLELADDGQATLTRIDQVAELSQTEKRDLVFELLEKQAEAVTKILASVRIMAGDFQELNRLLEALASEGTAATLL